MEMTKEGEVFPRRVVCVVECGLVVNPDTVKAQIEGGILFGLTAALFNEITVKNGRVEQSNFNDYRMLRITEAPVVEVYVMKRTEAPGGIGEAGTVVAAPALTNAIFAQPASANEQSIGDASDLMARGASQTRPMLDCVK